MPESLRIGLLTHSVNPRGGVVHTLELAGALHRLGHRVTVFAPALPGQTMFRPVAHELALVPVHAVEGGLAELVGDRIEAFRDHLGARLAQERFDVLHAHDGIGGNALADLAEAGLIDGFVRTVHHLDPFDDARLARWQTRSVRAARQVLCVSATWRERLQRELGVEAAQVANVSAAAPPRTTPRWCNASACARARRCSSRSAASRRARTACACSTPSCGCAPGCPARSWWWPAARACSTMPTACASSARWPTAPRCRRARWC
jgi:hypothetical protein